MGKAAKRGVPQGPYAVHVRFQTTATDPHVAQTSTLAIVWAFNSMELFPSTFAPSAVVSGRPTSNSLASAGSVSSE